MNMNRQILRGRKDDDKRKRESALYSSDVNHGLVAKQLSEGPSFKVLYTNGQHYLFWL